MGARPHGDADWGPGIGSVVEIFSRVVCEHGSRRGLVVGRSTLTFAEIDDLSRRVATGLLASGVRPGSRLALCGTSCVELYCGLLGVLRAGCSYVPLDPSYPIDRLRFMVEDASIEHALVAGSSAAGCVSLPVESLMVSQVVADAGHPGSVALPEVSGEGEAYVLYTSGSTGRPKGVSVAHWHLAALMRSLGMAYDFDHTDVWTVVHSFAFDWSIMELWGAWAFGGCAVIAQFDELSNFLSFGEVLQENSVTVLNIGPSVFRVALKPEAVESGSLSSLRYVIFGSERVDPHILRPYFPAFASQGTHLINLYGITETTIGSIAHELEEADLERVPDSPIGHPLPGLEVTVRDSRHLPLGQSRTGEIVIGGWGVADGYVGHAEGHRGRFIADPARSGDRMVYLTGDLGRFREDGVLLFEGRADRQMKIRGVRIEPAEIELALEKHISIERAIVAAAGDPANTRLLAYYVRSKGASGPAPGELRAAVEGRLPSQFVPVSFVEIPSIPLTVNGKVDLAALVSGGNGND